MLGSAHAVTVSINSPANNTSVVSGQVVPITVSFGNSVAGVQRVTISGQNDADGTNDQYNYGAFPPKVNGTVSGSYTVPGGVTNGQILTITATVIDYVDGSVSTSANLVALAVSAPANDSFSAAATITGESGSITGTSAGATKETGEPNHGNFTGGKSVWWKWTAPQSKPVTIDTVGSGFDTLLGVYTGSAVNALTLVAGDDESGGNNTSRVSFNATAGTTYYIAVDGFSGASGTVKLNWEQGGDAVVNIGYYVIDAVYNPVQDKLYLTNNGARRIDIVDPSTAQIIGNYPLPGQPNTVSVSPDGTKLACAMSTSQTVQILSLPSGTVLATKSTAALAGGRNPQFTCWSSNDVLLIGMGGSGAGFGGTTRPIRYTLSSDTMAVVNTIHTDPFLGNPTDPYFMKMNATGKIFLCNLDVSSSYLYSMDNNCSTTVFQQRNVYSRTIDASPVQDQFLHLDTNGNLKVLNPDLSTRGSMTGVATAVFGGGKDFVLALDSAYPSPVPLKVYRPTGELAASKLTAVNSFDVFGPWTRLYRGKSTSAGPQQVFAINNSQYKLHILNVPQVVTAAEAGWELYE